MLRKNSARSIKAFNKIKLCFGSYLVSVPADLFFLNQSIDGGKSTHQKRLPKGFY